MMRKKCLIRCMVAFVMCFIATSCSKNDSSSEQEMTDSFTALVMGGKSIDPNQTWNTATTIPVKVSVNLESDSQYTVYLYLSNPACDSEACYVGMAKLQSGESRTIYANAPAGTKLLYAACYGNNSKTALCKPVSDAEVEFSGNITSSPGIPSPTTGNNWSVPIQNMPNTDKYTSGSLISPEEINPELDSDAEVRIKIDGDYNGIIAGLTSRSNYSVYVTGTWTLTFDERVNNGNVIVVGDGGKLVVPKQFRLTTAPQIEERSPGMIYVLPGGEISGEGSVEFTDGEGTYSYNAGTITCKQIHLTSGTLYNSGTIGSSSNTQTSLYGEASVNNKPGQLFNYTQAYLLQSTGASLSILNAGEIYVSGTLTLSSSSRMDDGALIKCNTIYFSNTDNSNSVLYMGNGSYLNCSGAANFNNYGIWGPSGSNYKSNALVSFSSCSSCSHTSGNAYTYLLDHVQLQLPSYFSDQEIISGWVNGSEGGIEISRQTCYFSFESTSSPFFNGMFYAFEIPSDEDVKDFDYNDLILFVSAPYDNGDGTFSSFINIAAIGTMMDVTVFHNGIQLGEEVHKLMGIEKEKTINTTTVTYQPLYMADIKLNSSNADITAIPFTLQIARSNGTGSQTLSQPTIKKQAPLYIAVSADAQGKWRWGKEGTNIGLAFPKFSPWASNQSTNNDWYNSIYASSPHIIPAW